MLLNCMIISQMLTLLQVKKSAISSNLDFSFPEIFNVAQLRRGAEQKCLDGDVAGISVIS